VRANIAIYSNSELRYYGARNAYNGDVFGKEHLKRTSLKCHHHKPTFDIRINM